MLNLGTRQERKLRVLCFDTECRPMHYSEWRPESQITAVGYSWLDADGKPEKVHVETLKQSLSNEVRVFAGLLAAIRKADLVVGHYIRKHDLPLLNDHAIRFGLTPLGGVLVQDTMKDVKAVKALGLGQENLSQTFGLDDEKHSMSGAKWRSANGLAKGGIEQAAIRVETDVIQCAALRVELLRRRALHTPSTWSS